MDNLDVQNPFTNIPWEKTIENCANDLVFDKSKINNQTKNDVYDLLSVAAKEFFFWQ